MTSLLSKLQMEEASYGRASDFSERQDTSLSPKDSLRITFGTIWLVDAILKWLPGFRDTYMGTIMGQARGQPAWLKPWFDYWINLQHARSVFFADVVATVEMNRDGKVGQ
jgi:hypothetical protein